MGENTGDRGLEHVAGRVWLYPHDPDPDAIGASVAVIADERGSVLIDAGNSPAHAREVRRAIAAAGLPAPRWLVYTHHHWDHTWGACAWADVEVIAHASATALLAAEADRPWSHQYLRDQVTENPKLGPSFRARALAVPDFGELRIVLPHRTFTDTLTLPTGVVLRFVGGNHAPDSLVAVDPDSDVMLVGDCYFPPPFHLRTDADTPDLPMARRLLAERHAYFIDSHSAPRRTT
ncbi:beta-lactamase domain protein [Kribbella flavida DSM 17836]|uniref:Beta-lactamase domain protein n=1 Tax=Kribbella flavida (strain DSM 17836 / JCM 10339 / NBRC 14399) TaxID=479435 RepID=D2Q3M0_KRIFD|nr:MBL fold metallo-hydrolase [Kribbella flavida]ADB34143.1 beta-lactamase domain protein [Kribbella flavida DSM 17836]